LPIAQPGFICVPPGARIAYEGSGDFTCNHVSVLAPIGAALLGLSAEQSITWQYGGRDPLRIRVAALLYQPEAAGAAA
jgi:regulator of nucleoside diphosphate kinase